MTPDHDARVARITRLLRLGSPLLLPATILAVATAVLKANLAAGLYPIEADSIGIPLASTLFDCVLLAAVLALIALASEARLAFRGKGHRRTALAVSIGMLIPLYAIAVACLILSGAQWLDTLHYRIVAMYGIAAVFVAWLAFGDYRRRAA